MWAGRLFLRFSPVFSKSIRFTRRFTYSIQSKPLIYYHRPITLGFLGWIFGSSVDYASLRKDIAGLLDDLEHDDGSWGPLFVRLAWHASGTYDKNTKKGGSNGATMRFSPESDDPANTGLHLARDRLNQLKEKYPNITYSDLWILASYVAIEEMGGPHIEFKPGRKDKAAKTDCPPVGLLPDASQGAKHVRDVFYRMGFNDQEIVALVGGGHAIGRCHVTRSGYDGPWTNSPTTMSNTFFTELLQTKWVPKKWNGPKQFVDEKTGKLMMLPTDLELKNDPEFRKWTEIYAKDSDKFLKDFAQAYKKLTELGL